MQDKNVDCQCSEVTMRSVFQRHGNVEHVLGPELVTGVIPFLGTAQTGKNKTIIAKNVADGKLQFSHGSF